MYDDLFLGLDISTQSLTAVVIDHAKRQIQKKSLNYDKCFQAYGTSGGVIVGDNPKVVHSNPLMWVEALDDMLRRLQTEGLTKHIRGVGVSAQQHGSVYLNPKALFKLAHLDCAFALNEQIKDIFSRSTSPVWMDSSTHRECVEITQSLGGNSEVARLTGSIATERFAGPQIRKFWKENPAGYHQTAHVALISSFITSLLIGRLAPVDAGDGFGMNLADIHTRQWSEAALAATAPELKRRLPQLTIRDEVVGKVAHHMVERYGFDPQTNIIVGSGDNPCSLVGLGMIGDSNLVAISLGTSDTYFGYTSQISEEKRACGHIFGAADGGYMFLICFQNGSLAREQVKDRFGLSWDEFSTILEQRPPGNQGQIMLPYFFPEITPLVLEPGVHRFGGLEENDVQANVRAVAEAQIMAMYVHSGWTGRRPKTILVTAGGSENKGLLKVISQVFGAGVRSFEVKESAALGAAIRAAHCCLNQKGRPVEWRDLTDPFIESSTVEVIHPSPEDTEIYHGEHGLLSLYEVCERFAQGKGQHPEAKIEKFRTRF
jgi:xylulokinase